jgi:hypothetical protein
MHSGFQIGLSFCREKKLECKHETKSNNLVKMLDEGMATSLLLSTVTASRILCASKQENIYYRLDGDFEKEAFHYVHQKHAKLLPALSDAIVKMKLSEPYLLFNRSWTARLKSCGKNLIKVTN